MLTVGLGNPGPTYANNRHNIGFMVIDELVCRKNAQKLSSSSFKGDLFKYSNNFLLKPLTYMNLSGESILVVKNFYKLDKVIVIHDDLDLPFGAVRFKLGGGNGGHNGLKSIDEKISKNYIKVRMGISKPQHRGEVTSYVLSNFTELESQHLNKWISHAADAIEYLVENSLEDTSSKYTIKKL